MKGWTVKACLLLISLCFFGCAVYTPRDIRSVQALISEASAAGAKKKAAYEYHSAVEYLKIAKEELDEADDKSAQDFGEKARAMAEKALQKSR